MSSLTPEEVIAEVDRDFPDKVPFIRTGQVLRAYIITSRESEGVPKLRALLKRKISLPRSSARWVERLGMIELVAAAYLLSVEDLALVRHHLDTYDDLIQREEREDARDEDSARADDDGDADPADEGEDDDINADGEQSLLSGLLREAPRVTARALADLLEDGALRRAVASDFRPLREQIEAIDEEAVRAGCCADPDTDEETAEMIANALLRDRSEALFSFAAIDAVARRDRTAFRRALVAHSRHAESTQWVSFPELEWLALGRKAVESGLGVVRRDFVGWERPFVGFAVRRT